MPLSQNIAPSSEDIPPEEKSQYRMIKDAGYNNMHDFMLSYGIKPSSLGGYDEARQIIDIMRRHDQEIWEAEHNGQNQDYSDNHEAHTSEPNQGYYEDWKAEQDVQRFEVCEGNDDYDEGAVEHHHQYYEGAADQSDSPQSHYSDDWEAGSAGEEECYDNWDCNEQYDDDYE
ncbi:uncharacterized protein BO80DRAFT_361175 [Aspergillus ibericus CBS 121593]|uniref:Uncharacterized protein n=1 Tax=Aspergillus ibericus CBS 121593 TaxID=1448316 RepID=A0A395GU24_9EURO|nr:hypothetical protein BO80DRAFT_361175 [Aspergillus ibericus CBS 121593]RAK98684.1 hypothetical protein BO80DRAFT_361175 [Aspergillus ibericus CBS 121593]